MRVGEFLEDVGGLEPDWDEELDCASCGAPILELQSRGGGGAMLGIERVHWADGTPAGQTDHIVCPRCGCRSPIARPHMRDPLLARA